MAPAHYTRLVLQERPKGDIDANTFRRETIPFDLKPGSCQVLVRTEYVSIDAAMRSWLRDVRSYIPPVQIGDVMRADGLATVIEAGVDCKLKPGDIVRCTPGWAEYAVLDEKTCQALKVPPGAEPLDFLGPLGITGMTAYFGLHDVGKIKPGDTLVVSGAAGATGSLVCQLAKIHGAKVVAIAGSEDKCKWLTDELGVDVAFNYKSRTFYSDFKKRIGYIDLFFDNVGGSLLNFMLTRLNKGARIVLCGAISDYNSDKPTGLSAYSNLISQRASLQGFIVFDYASRYREARQEMAEWLASGKLKRRFQVVEGLENAPKALLMLYSGGNTGKLVVRVSSPRTQAKL
ncbi:alcohol dehydrogenase [Vararia minispora EC-137]|uniref:Alcohol dehydrogenase n=1 Tax=Vararia minispora EC-137 TaxID=1314806 RepID=A0ACB8QLL6_9AGAM|nr:alcohol dehydrogenase [Vararia minispora EC-137]